MFEGSPGLLLRDGEVVAALEALGDGVGLAQLARDWGVGDNGGMASMKEIDGRGRLEPDECSTRDRGL